MVNDLSAEERETIILYSEAGMKAEVSTFNAALIRRLAELRKERPDECTGHGPNDYGEACYMIPKKWIKINPTRILSEENKKLRSEIAKRIKSK